MSKKAPNFSVMSDEGKMISLSDFKGKKVVLYFYPKDNTPGCTKESCGFNESLSKFEKHNVVVLGVSKDDVKKHQKFKEKYGFQFNLLADTEGELCKAYGVLAEKNMFGKKYMGIVRSTFLIDENGNIEKEWRKVSVPGHVDEVLKSVS
ncbi:MAG: thioredoxin-dependent thiol peroxidase [Gammaproteobacteria bacterium]